MRTAAFYQLWGFITGDLPGGCRGFAEYLALYSEAGRSGSVTAQYHNKYAKEEKQFHFMKVLVSGGGTGGHIYPALAVATQLVKQYQAEILYLGSDDGLENELAPAAGFPLVIVKAGKLRRYISWQTLTGVARIPVGMAQAVGIVRKFNPDVVFTSGGYVAVPAGLGARLNGAPLLMHQQDVPPNLSNRLIAPLATRISVAFADSLAYFPTRTTRQFGNPSRQEMFVIRPVSPQEARRKLELEADLPVLLVTGASQGTRNLNQLVSRALPASPLHCPPL